MVVFIILVINHCGIQPLWQSYYLAKTLYCSKFFVSSEYFENIDEQPVKDRSCSLVLPVLLTPSLLPSCQSSTWSWSLLIFELYTKLIPVTLTPKHLHDGRPVQYSKYIFSCNSSSIYDNVNWSVGQIKCTVCYTVHRIQYIAYNTQNTIHRIQCI